MIMIICKKINHVNEIKCIQCFLKVRIWAKRLIFVTLRWFGAFVLLLNYHIV